MTKKKEETTQGEQELPRLLAIARIQKHTHTWYVRLVHDIFEPVERELVHRDDCFVCCCCCCGPFSRFGALLCGSLLPRVCAQAVGDGLQLVSELCFPMFAAEIPTVEVVFSAAKKNTPRVDTPLMVSATSTDDEHLTSSLLMKKSKKSSVEDIVVEQQHCCLATLGRTS